MTGWEYKNRSDSTSQVAMSGERDERACLLLCKGEIQGFPGSDGAAGEVLCLGLWGGDRPRVKEWSQHKRRQEQPGQ